MMINQGLDQGHTLENHRTSDFGRTINHGIDEMRGRSGYWKVTGHHHHHLISHKMRALVPNSWERIIAERKWNWVLMCVVFHPMVMIPRPHAFPAFRTIVNTNQPEWMVLVLLLQVYSWLFIPIETLPQRMLMHFAQWHGHGWQQKVLPLDCPRIAHQVFGNTCTVKWHEHTRTDIGMVNV